MRLWTLIAFACEAGTLDLDPTPPPPPAPEPSRSDASTDPPPAADIVPSSIDFGDVTEGSRKVRVLSAINRHGVPTTVVVPFSAPPFAVESQELTLPPYTRTDIRISFEPTSPGLHQSTLTIDSCGAGCPFDVRLVGTGERDPFSPPPPPDDGSCASDVCPTELHFGPVPLGTTALWNFACYCPIPSGYTEGEMQPPIPGAEIEYYAEDLAFFLSFTPQWAARHETNLIISSTTSAIVVRLVLVSE